jgi:hypothetical protein
MNCEFESVFLEENVHSLFIITMLVDDILLTYDILVFMYLLLHVYSMVRPIICARLPQKICWGKLDFHMCTSPRAAVPLVGAVQNYSLVRPTICA